MLKPYKLPFPTPSPNSLINSSSGGASMRGQLWKIQNLNLSWASKATSTDGERGFLPWPGEKGLWFLPFPPSWCLEHQARCFVFFCRDGGGGEDHRCEQRKAWRAGGGTSLRVSRSEEEEGCQPGVCKSTAV